MARLSCNMRLLVLCCLLCLSIAQDDGSDAPVFEPLFSSGGVMFIVDEGAPEGTEVGTVRAQGLPEETVVYGVELAEEWEGVFSIDSESGQITVGPGGPDSLVIEDGMEVMATFQVYAYYDSAGPSGNRSYLSVTVEVQDVNSSPYFEEQDTDIYVVEGISVGTVIDRFTAMDDDLGSNAALQYTLEQVAPNGDTTAFFSIQQFTGDITVAQNLNVNSTYRLTITATDEGSPPLSASLNVSVRVNPVPPTFGQQVYEADLMEFTDKTGVSVVTVSATALSGNTVTYAVDNWTPAPSGLNFSIDSSSGHVVASGTLDRETYSRYTIIVEAYEHPETASEATVIVHVEDVNEPPEFLRTHYSAEVSEGAEIGEVLYSEVMAVDRDDGTNADLSYSLSNISGLATQDGERVAITQQFFTINSTTAVLHVNTDLEREEEVDGYHYYEITIVAADGGSPSLSSSTLLTVTVTDINDNPPTFTNSTYTFTLTESAVVGSVVGTVEVEDSDEGQAANITFSLSGSSSERFRIAVLSVDYPSSINSRPPTVTRGRIYTTEMLDREDQSSYELTILAQDTTDQPLNGTSQLRITVLDSNDNRPQFEESTYSFDVIEETLPDGKIIGELNATDADEGSNAAIDYSLAVSTAEAQLFSLQTTDSAPVRLLLQQELDRETTDFYTFRLLATDRGSPSLVGETRINITVLDVNDHSPVFSEARYEVEVSEDAAVGTALLTVSASDGDIGDNGRLQYSTAGQLVLVGGQTGNVSLQVVLDYETSGSVEIEITAADFGNPQRNGTATVVINVMDVNDNAPVFDSLNYTVSVGEDVTVGAELVRVLASDADSEERGRVTYNLTASGENGVISIDSTSGAITVAMSLDREETEEYEFIITAVDGGNPPMSSSVVLYLTVQDVNDNAPAFEGAPFSAQVSEGVSPNSSVGAVVTRIVATDPDSGSNSDVRYHLSGSGVEFFSIDPITGEVTVVQAVDYESVDAPYVLTVTAEDLGEDPMSSVTTLMVTVTDGNDHAPVFFNEPYTVLLEEGTSGPLVVLSVTATDRDDGSNGEIEFLLIGGDGQFSIDPQGNISLLGGRTLDREASDLTMDDSGNGVISLVLTAVDNGSPIQLTQTTVTVLVSDINDNAPVFQQASYSVRVSEALGVGDTVLNLLATDQDYGTNAEIVYSIASQEPALGGFAVDAQTGSLTVAASLDREEQPTFSLIISATDQGPGSHSVNVSVVVNVMDVNDNHPVFSVPSGGFIANVSEDIQIGSEIITVVATDRDQGTDAEITYSLRDSTVPFQIQDPTVGRITVSSPLDRENASEYRLLVTASDTDPGSDTVLQTDVAVTVHVLDVNDNSPQFFSSSFEGRVRENRPIGSTVDVIPELLAVDADTAANGQITYTLTGADSQYFSLDPQTAQLTTAAIFDAEMIQSLTDLQVAAADSGGLSTTTSLTVFIQNENDLTPVFTVPAGTNRTISEALSPGSQVITVAAVDGDVQEDTLTYSLEGDGSETVFTIDHLTGAISVGEQGLDYEATSSFLLTVAVTDGGSPPRNASTDVLILLEDVNDNSPVFLGPSQPLEVMEYTPVGTTIGRVEVEDADSPEVTQLSYQIVGGDEGGRFAINSTTGHIATAANVDREEQELYTLLIEARDAPQLFHATTGAVVVTIADVNDNPPVFPAFMTEAQVEEERSVGTQVTVVTAVDSDFGENGTVTYSLVFSEPQEHFTINSTTGEVLTTVILDRENIDSYTLIIQANDGGTPSLMNILTLNITVLDVNDNDPQIMGSQEATIIENAPVGSLVQSNLSATDADIGTNSELVWIILSGNIFDAFSIDSTTGMITVANTSELDYESTPSFFLQIGVADMGQPQRSSGMLLRIRLLDSNDHAPTLPSVAPISLPENTLVGSIIALVAATDEDEGTNSQLNYQILSGNTGGAFTFVSDGTIRTATALDYETVQNYELVVEVEDGGTPPQLDTTTVVVMVTDINDNAPVFNVQPLAQVLEGALNPIVVAISASDPDSGANGQVDVSILTLAGAEPPPFTISSGFLRVDGALDREEQSQHVLLLQAQDAGSPPLSTQAQLTVNVADIDDNPPMFPEPPHYTISEAQPTNTPFALLMTEDLDTASNSDAFYYITGGETADSFGVTDTGQLFLTKSLDREAVAVHVIEITAQSFQGDSSSCTETTCTTTNITVSLMDVNDNSPQWTQGQFIIGVNETAAVGEAIGMLQARDPDSGNFGVVRYRLTDTNAGVVTLDEETGALRLNQSYQDLGMRVSAIFTAQAYDNLAVEPSTTSTNVAIRVAFINAEHLVIITISQPFSEAMADPSVLYRALEMVPGAALSVFDIQEHDSSRSTSKRQSSSSETDLLVFAIDPNTGALLSSQDTLQILSANVNVTENIFSVVSIVRFPEPESDDEGDGISTLTLTIVVAAVIVGVLLAMLLFTASTCCWLQSRLRQKKHYRPGRTSYSPPRESVRYSSAEGVELWAGIEEQTEQRETEESGSKRHRVKKRVKKGHQYPAASGAQPHDSRESQELRQSVLYESKDYVMDFFQDSDGDESEEEVEIKPPPTFTAIAKQERREREFMELREMRDSRHRDGGEGESGGGGESEGEGEDDTLPMIRPVSQSTAGEVEEGDREEGEEGEGEVEVEEEEEEEDTLSPADMMTEEEAMMLAAPLEEDSVPNPLMY